MVEKLLRKDPALRYARAEDLIVDLASIGRTLAAGGGPSTAATVAMPAERPAPRIAVLYFEAMSTDPDDAFLAAGLTEDLIVDLARVEGLRVAARGEVQPFRGRDLPPRTVARELGVEFVVQGSVRRAAGARASTPSSCAPRTGTPRGPSASTARSRTCSTCRPRSPSASSTRCR